MSFESVASEAKRAEWVFGEEGAFENVGVWLRARTFVRS